MKKSIYTLFLLILTLFSLSFGQIAFANAQNENPIYETNSFRIIRQADESGKIALSYIFPVNSKLLEEDFTEGEVQTYRFYLSTFVNALAKQNRDKGVEGVSVSGCTYFTDVDGLGFSVVFEDVAAQKRFFGVEENPDEDSSEEKAPKTSGFFMKRMEFSTTFPVSSKKSAEELKAICNMAISSWCKDNSIPNEKKSAALAALEESVFIYDFATTQSTLKSDLMYDDENFHHNVFVKTMAELEENNQITFYTTYPNTPVWYASALLVVIAAMCMAYVILSRKKGKTPKNANQIC